MENIYSFETIKELEKEIVDKAIMVDINYSFSYNLLECFIRMIRTIVIWIGISIIPTIWVKLGYVNGLKALGIYLCIWIVGSLLMSWVKFNSNEAYTKMKVQLVENLICECKEWVEADYDVWQKKQIHSRFLSLARLEKLK